VTTAAADEQLAHQQQQQQHQGASLDTCQLRSNCKTPKCLLCRPTARKQLNAR
jgi:hypothetical protein